MPPVINKAKCTACGKCADVCPLDVFFWLGEEKDAGYKLSRRMLAL